MRQKVVMRLSCNARVVSSPRQLDERRYRTVESVGNGAKQFGLSDLQNSVARNRLRAGVEHPRPELRCSLRQMIQGPVDLRQIAIVVGQHRNAFGAEAKSRHTRSKGRPGGYIVLLAELSERGNKDHAI